MSKSLTVVSSVAAGAEPQTELNERNIKAAQPGDILRDANIKGLHLRCFPTQKVFYLYYRTKVGIRRTPKLDAYGKITLAQARAAAQDLLMQVAAGKDPMAERETAKAEWTLADLWKEWRAKRGAKKKSEKEDQRLWDKKLQGLADKRLSEIDYQACYKLHADLTKETPITANRVLALLSTLMNFAVAPLRMMEKNPTEGIEHNQETKRKRYMTAGEAVKIYEGMLAAADKEPASIAFLWLLLLSGARKGEIAKAKWTQLRGTKLVLKEHKAEGTGDDRVIHLAPEAMEVLAKLPRVLGGTITGIKDPKKLWDTIRTDAGCPDLRMHDLRHSFASAAISAGKSLPQIGELLGHHDAQTTMRYAHLVDEAAASATADAASQIMRNMKGA